MFKKIFSFLIVLFFLFSFQKKKNPIEGFWELTEEKPEEHSELTAGFIFTDEKMFIYAGMGGGLMPHIIDSCKYIYHQKYLLLEDSLKYDTISYQLKSNKLILISGINTGDTIYLKRLKK